MNILLVDPEQHTRSQIKNFLSDLNYEVTAVTTGKKAMEASNQGCFHLILTALNLPDLSGLDLIDQIKHSAHSNIPAIVIYTAHADSRCVIQALRKGAHDFLLKPINWTELYSVIQRLLEQEQGRPALNTARELTKEQKPKTITGFAPVKDSHIYIEEIGPVFLHTPAIRHIYDLASAVHSDRSIPVLIEGETGTGKELIARYIHFANKDQDQPFIALNCSTLTHALFESEVFGYDAGAFTGAMSGGKHGKFDLAEGGTLFLDEISEIPVKMQAKLLRVLQEKAYYRLGGLKQIHHDVRIICATNRNIQELIDNRRFRSDLFYRINTVHLKVPPLRERTADIIPLAQTFLREFSLRRNKNFSGISDSAAQLLQSYTWPGNIRQLRSAIDTVTLFYNDRVLKVKHLDLIRGDPHNHNKNPVPVHSPDQITFGLDQDRLPLERVNKEVVLRILEMHKGNISKTARYLDISTRSLTYRLKKWGSNPTRKY